MDNLKRKLKLGDLLAPLAGDEAIQIIIDGTYTNIAAGSPLLEPFYEWTVTFMCTAFYTDDPAIIVRIVQPRITPHQSA